MLSGVYVEAFKAFLQLAELEWPQSIDHPTVALFLLVCDLAINPGVGFPLTLRSFKVFIEDVDPGMRFLYLCRTVATKRQELKMFIIEYSRDEYAAATEALAISLLVDSPLAIVETVNRWARWERGCRRIEAGPHAAGTSSRRPSNTLRLLHGSMSTHWRVSSAYMNMTSHSASLTSTGSTSESMSPRPSRSTRINAS